MGEVDSALRVGRLRWRDAGGDAGQAAAFMQLAAWELGVGSVPASIYEAEKARGILGFPDEWHLRIALSFGFPLDEKKLSTPPKKGGRVSLEDVVHWDRW